MYPDVRRADFLAPDLLPALGGVESMSSTLPGETDQIRDLCPDQSNRRSPDIYDRDIISGFIDVILFDLLTLVSLGIGDVMIYPREGGP